MKKELRKKMKELRAALPEDVRDEAAFRVACLLKEEPVFKNAGTLFCYASVGAELSTEYIVRAHPRVAFPKVFPNGEMRFYVGGVLQPGFRGIPEPVGGEEVLPDEADLMLLPGLAFSMRDGGRLGYGGGYYDRYLAALEKQPIRCGICYEEQAVMDKVPSESHDQKMDMLVFPRWVSKFRDF